MCGSLTHKGILSRSSNPDALGQQLGLLELGMRLNSQLSFSRKLHIVALIVYTFDSNGGTVNI